MAIIGTIHGLTANPQGQPVLPATAKNDLSADIGNATSAVRQALNAAGLGKGASDADIAGFVADTATATGSAVQATTTRAVRQDRITPASLGATASHPVASKPLTAPVFGWDKSTATSVLWPYMVDNTRHGGTGWSMIYSTDHATHETSGIYRATAPNPLAAFTDAGMVFRDDAGGSQTETPSVVWDDRVGEWIMYYQQAKGAPTGGTVGVGVGVQSTLYATSPNLTTWTRQGIAAEMRTSADAGDGHTGYFKPFDLGGTHYAYSMYASTNQGSFALWRSGDRRKWTMNPTQIGAQGAILPEQYAGIVGTPMSTPETTPTATTSPWTPKMFIGDVIVWKGRPWWIGLVGPRSAGGATAAQRLMAAPLRDDLLGLAETPVDITPPAQAWEGVGGLEQLGNIFTWDGRTFITYRVGGLRGFFGILEVN